MRNHESLSRRIRSLVSRTQAAQRRRRRTLFVENLEERRVLATWYVDDDFVGVELGTLAQPFNTIQEGVNAAAATGDTVEVAAGTYAELVSINKSLELLGAQAGVDARTGRTPADANESTIDGSGLGGVIYIAGTGVTVKVDGFTLQADTSISVSNGGYGAAVTTVHATNPTGLNVSNNIIQHASIGIAPRGDAAVIQYNLIQDMDIPGPAAGTGIYTDWGLTNSLIDHNKIINNPNSAIDINTSGGSNTISNNDTEGEIYLHAQSGSQVTGNTITNSSGGGIVLGGGQTGLTISNNDVIGVASGFAAFRLRDDLGGPNGSLTVTNNHFSGGANGYGVRASAGSVAGVLTIAGSQISGGLGAIANLDAALTINASSNYFGSSVPATVATYISGAGAAIVDFTPLLNHDESVPNQAVVGFQADLSSVTVHTLGLQTGGVGRIQEGVNVVTSGGTVDVVAGTYAENVLLAKSVTMLGAKANVDARGRVVGAPNPAVETVVAPAAGSPLEFQGSSGGSMINGFAFVGNLSGATGVITSTSGPINAIELRNNFVNVVSGQTAAALWLNDTAINATIDQNEFVGATGSTQVVFLDGSDQFHGLYFTNNNVLRSGSLANTGFFVDGNRNVGTSTGPGGRSPLIQGNLFQNHSLAFNAGQRAFQDAQFVENTFTANTGGLAGGPKNSTIARNTLTNNSLYGLRLTAFGNTADPLRGAQNTQVVNNVFSGNGTTVDLSAGYGDIRIDDQFNGTQSTNTISGNSLGSTVGAFNKESNAEVVNMSGNWWGTTANPESSSKILGVAAGNVDYSPWLNSGIDTNVGMAGFQGDYSVLSVDDDSVKSGVVPYIAEALISVTTGSPSQIIVFPGTYAEAVTINRNDLTSLTLLGQSGIASDVVINAGGSDGVAISAPATVTVQDLRITNANQGLTATGLTALTLSNLLIDASTSGGTIGTTPTVTFAGSPGADSMSASATQLSNTGLQAIGHSGISTLNLNGFAGNDTISVPLGGSPPGTINVDGGAHTTFDTLQVVGTSGDDALVVSGSTVTGGGPTISLSNLEKLTVNLSGNGVDSVQVNQPVTQPATSMLVSGGGTGSDTVNVDTGAAAAVIGIDSDSVDVAGQASIEYSNLDDIYVNSGDSADTYTVGPSPITTLHLDANLPSTGAGDVLNYVGPGGASTTINATDIQSTGYAPVYYTDFETINLGGELVVSGTGLDDTLDVTATGVSSGSYILTTDGTPGPTVGLSGVTKLTFDAQAGNDKLIIRNPAAGIFAPTLGIEYSGGTHTTQDELEILGGGSGATSGSYTVGPASDEGTVQHTLASNTQSIHFTGLEPVTDTTTDATFHIYASSSGDTINVSNGDVVGSVQTVKVDFDGAYESLQFGNKTAVTVHGGNGGDSINVSYTTAATGLSTLNLDGEGGGDSFQVSAATPAGVNTNLSGGSEGDGFDIDATLTGGISGGSESDSLAGDVIDDVVLTGSNGNGFSGTEPSITAGFSGIDSATGNGGTLTGRNVASTWGLDGTPTYGDGSQTLDFSSFANLQGGSAVDTFNVVSSSVFHLKGGDGNDSFVLSNGVTLTGSVDGNGGSDTLDYTAFSTTVNVDLTAGPPGTATNITGGILAGTGGDVGSSVENLRGGGAGDILVGDADVNLIRGNHGDDDINAKDGVDDVDGGLGNDTIRVALAEAEFDLIQGGPGGVGASGDYDTMVNDDCGPVTLNGFNSAFDVFANSIDEYVGAGQPIMGNGSGNELHFGFTKMTDTSGLDASTSNDEVTTSYSNVAEVAYSGGAGTDEVTLVFTPDQLDAMLTADIVAVQSYLTSPTGQTLSVTADDSKGNFTATQFESARLAVYDDSVIVNITSCFLAIVSELQILTGTSGNDTINGTNLTDLIFGEDGNDLIFGFDGSDCLFGGAGLDSVYGGNLDDLLVGGSGNDLLSGGDDEDQLNGGLGNDVLTGDAGQDLLHGNDGDDTLDGGDDIDTLNGDVGVDTVAGGNGADVIQIYADQAANDVMDGGASSDTLEILAAGGNATLIGFSNGVAGGGYVAEFSSNIEVIQGNGLGLLGTSANNWFDLSSVQPISLSFVDGMGGDDYLNGSGFPDDLRGGSGGDSIFGNAGFDSLSGGADNDYLDGGLNDDTLDGGAGIDTVLGSDGFDTIRVRTDEAEFDVMNGGANTDNVQNMAASPVILNAFNAATNGLEGWIGNGQAIWGDDSDNVLSFLIVSPTTSMTLTGVTNIDGRGGNDTITGTNGTDVIYGGLGDDVINGMYGSDYLYGYGSDLATSGDTGNDTLSGGDGVDHLYGGAGDDRILTGAGRDIVYYPSNLPAQGNDQIDDFTTSDRISFVGAGWNFGSLSQVVAAPDLNINLPNGKTIKIKNRTSALPSYVFLFT